MNSKDEIKEIVERPSWSRFCSLGIPIMLLNFSIAMTGIVLTDLIVYRTCLVPLGIEETECSTLRTNGSSLEAIRLEADVEPYATHIVMTKMLMESVVPPLITLFLGPWSDRGGRKPLLSAGLAGFTVTFIALALMSSWNISPWYLLIASIPSSVMGGPCSVTLGAICHISDTTTETERVAPLAWIEASGFIGDVLGALIGPIIYQSFGYTDVFGTAAICSGLSLAYTQFLIPETVKSVTQKSIRGLFDISVVKKLLAGSTVKRDGYNPLIVWLALFALNLNIMIDKGHTAIEFLFTRLRLGWNVQQYFHYNTAATVLRIVGLSAVLLRGHLSDTTLGGIGFMSALGSAVTKSLAWEDWHMYLAAIINMFSGMTVSVMRSVISKFAPADEIGEIFSLAMLLEMLSPFGSSPLYTLIYSHYLPPIHPSPVFLLSSVFFIILILCVVFIDVTVRKSRNLRIYVAASQNDS